MVRGEADGYRSDVEGDVGVAAVTAGLNDPRVSYWEPAKWLQLLRERSQSDAKILLRTEMSAGHFARSGRYDSWRDEAIVLAFVLTHLSAA